MRAKWLGPLALPALLCLTGCQEGGGGERMVAHTESEGTTISLSTGSGTIVSGKNDLTVSFSAAGKPKEVQESSIRFFMPAMGAMAAMVAEFPLQATGRPGVFQGTIELPMKGSWQTTISFRDSAGSHRAVLGVLAR